MVEGLEQQVEVRKTELKSNQFGLRSLFGLMIDTAIGMTMGALTLKGMEYICYLHNDSKPIQDIPELARIGFMIYTGCIGAVCGYTRDDRKKFRA